MYQKIVTYHYFYLLFPRIVLPKYVTECESENYSRDIDRCGALTSEGFRSLGLQGSEGLSPHHSYTRSHRETSNALFTSVCSRHVYVFHLRTIPTRRHQVSVEMNICWNIIFYSSIRRK